MEIKAVNAKTTAVQAVQENSTDKKYILTEECIEYKGRKLYRIKAIKDFGDIKAGDIGGFVENESNLSHSGNCWIYNNAKVFDDASVHYNGSVSGNAIVFRNAMVVGGMVKDNARVSGSVLISGEVSDKAYVRTGNNFSAIHGAVKGTSSLYGEIFIDTVIVLVSGIHRDIKIHNEDVFRDEEF